MGKTIFSGAATKTKEKKGATEQLSLSVSAVGVEKQIPTWQRGREESPSSMLGFAQPWAVPRSSQVPSTRWSCQSEAHSTTKGAGYGCVCVCLFLTAPLSLVGLTENQTEYHQSWWVPYKHRPICIVCTTVEIQGPEARGNFERIRPVQMYSFGIVVSEIIQYNCARPHQFFLVLTNFSMCYSRGVLLSTAELLAIATPGSGDSGIVLCPFAEAT